MITASESVPSDITDEIAPSADTVLAEPVAVEPVQMAPEPEPEPSADYAAVTLTLRAYTALVAGTVTDKVRTGLNRYDVLVVDGPNLMMVVFPPSFSFFEMIASTTADPSTIPGLIYRGSLREEDINGEEQRSQLHSPLSIALTRNGGALKSELIRRFNATEILSPNGSLIIPIQPSLSEGLPVNDPGTDAMISVPPLPI